MKIITLMEDQVQDTKYCYEHGLSFYLETKHHHLLLDTGASEKTWENAKQLGIDLTKIDTIVISHGHYDHAGGLLSFLNINPNVKVYIHKNAIYPYTHLKNGIEKYIGMDQEIATLQQVIWIEENLIIDDELSLFTNITGRRLWPKGNLTLHKHLGDQYIQDIFDHEICLVLQDDNKHVLLSGCAHNGILNILDTYQSIYKNEPDIVLSGFHMQQSQGYLKEDIENIQLTASLLSKMHTVFYTGHCTGIIPYDTMKDIMKDQLQYMNVGKEIIINE